MKVLFVCTGNINRSAAADIIFNESGCGGSRSVGTGKTALKRGKMASKMRRVLESMGYNPEGFRSTPINEEDLKWADKVVCMGNPHVRRIEEEFPQHAHKIEVWKVMDPHFSKGEEDHRMVAGQVRDLVLLHFSPQ